MYYSLTLTVTSVCDVCYTLTLTITSVCDVYFTLTLTVTSVYDVCYILTLTVTSVCDVCYILTLTVTVLTVSAECYSLTLTGRWHIFNFNFLREAFVKYFAQQQQKTKTNNNNNNITYFFDSPSLYFTAVTLSVVLFKSEKHWKPWACLGAVTLSVVLFKSEKHWKLWACSGANDPPIINNLNTELYVREDEAVGTNVLSLAAYDKTSNPSLTYTVSTVPSTASDLFHIVGQYVVV